MLLKRDRCADVSCWRSSHFVATLAFLTAHLPTSAGPSRLILLRNFRIIRRRKDRGGLWLSSRGLGCASVYSGSGDADWFGGLVWFVCVRAGSFCTTVPLFLYLWILASGFWWVEFLDRLRFLLWWFVSWGVPFWLVSGVLWADRFWFEVGSKFVTQVLLGCWDVSFDIPELEWWLKLNVWSKITIGCLIDHCWRYWFFEELLLGYWAFWGCWWFYLGFFGGFIFSFWCNTWDLIPLYIYYILALKKKKISIP